MPDIDTVMLFQKILLTLIKDKYKVSQESIAASIGLSRNSVNAYYNGRQVMRLDVLMALIQEYNLNPSITYYITNLLSLGKSLNSIMDTLGGLMDNE